MSNYSVLKQDINNNIYENQTQQITGTVLNAILNEMTASLGAGYQFAGVATLGMNPGDPDQRVFYLAGEGIYTSFGGIQVPAGKLGVLKWDNRWTLQTIDGLGGGGANLTGYVSVASTDDLPDEGVATLGYLCGTNLYLYVGTGGDTKEGKYQNCGSFRGPQGLQGDPGVGIATVTQTTTSTEDEGINVITVTKEDGTQSTFQVRNGSKGSQGIQGPQGVQGEPGRLQAQYKEVETLPTASADTVDYIYLVASQTPNTYDMYYTEENQGAYSWKSLGTTAVQLSDYATKDELSQLEAEGGEITDFVLKNYSISTNGTFGTNNSYKHGVLPVEVGETYFLTGDSNTVRVAYATSDASSKGGSVPMVDGTSVMEMPQVNTLYKFVIPSGCTYLIFNAGGNYGTRVFRSTKDKMNMMEDDIADLRQDVNNANYAIEEEVIDQTDITEEIIIQNGAENASTGIPKCTKLIPYSNKNKYVYSGGLENYNLNAAAYYDATGALVGYDNSPSGYISNRELTGIPSTTAYIRFCVWNVDERFKVEINSAVSEVIDNLPYVSPKENELTLDFTPGNTSSILSDFDANYDLILQFNLLRNGSGSGNPGFNFLYAKVKDKSNGNETTVHDCQDDICPTDFGGQYIGANHGGYGRMLITSNSHGKDYSDIGSIWSDGTHQYVLVGINNENRIYLIGENTAVYPLFSFAQASSTATFTHISGATHTESFTASAKTVSQWWPAYATPTTKVYLDGKEVTTSGTYKFREMVISEVYDVLNPASCLEIVKTNVGTYIENPKPGNLSGADKYSRHTITYTFHGADKCIVATSITAYQNIGDGYFGFIQQAMLENASKLYIPTVKSMEGGSVQVDFRLPVTIDATINGNVIKKTDCEKPLLPADRWLQYSNTIGFYAGYLFDYGVGGNNRAAVLGDGVIHISNATKMYPRGIGIEMEALDNYSAVCFRNYLSIAGINTDGIIAKNLFEYKDALYIYADFKTAGMYEIDIPEKYQGKQVEVFDKRDNVTLLTQNAGSTILINVATSTPMTGYIVAKIS